MTEKKFITRSEDETKQLAQTFGRNLQNGVSVLLYGDLGSGKTVFVKGVGEALKISSVRSPSFTLINEYESPDGVFLIHSDLYRLDENQVFSLGLEEFIGAEDSVLFVEWPERWKNFSAENVIRIYFKALSESDREIKISAEGEKALKVIKNL